MIFLAQPSFSACRKLASFSRSVSQDFACMVTSYSSRMNAVHDISVEGCKLDFGSWSHPCALWVMKNTSKVCCERPLVAPVSDRWSLLYDTPKDSDPRQVRVQHPRPRGLSLVNIVPSVPCAWTGSALALIQPCRSSSCWGEEGVSLPIQIMTFDLQLSTCTTNENTVCSLQEDVSLTTKAADNYFKTVFCYKSNV